MKTILKDYHQRLVEHPVYQALDSLDAVRAFMEYHVYAVWDFMSLLKSLQTKITNTNVPWVPSIYSPDLVRMINEIVLAEESDLDQNGNPCSHFELYLKAMEEIGANTSMILDFCKNPNYLQPIPKGIKDFVEHNLQTAKHGQTEEVAASFFFGREKILPEIFEKIVEVIKTHSLDCPTLIYYFERHIELDGDEHGPMAEKCLSELCQNDPVKTLRAQHAGVLALRYRERLWDYALNHIQTLSIKSTSHRLI